MGLLKKVTKAVKKIAKGAVRSGLAIASGGLTETKFGKNLIAGIERDPAKAALIAGAAVLTGGAAAAAGYGTLAAGAAGAGVAGLGASKISQEEGMLKKEEKAQAAYDKAVAAENERAYAAQRASLLSMRRNYTQETGVGTLRRKKASTSYEQDLLG